MNPEASPVNPEASPVDEVYMRMAVEAAGTSRLLSSPNPWVGAVLVTAGGDVHVGSTRRPGGNHAEREVLEAAGSRARGGVLYCTLEPCNHQGRTGPCTEAIIDAGLSTVVIGVGDPDPRVAGAGIDRLRAAGLGVRTGVLTGIIDRQLAPYLHHRRTGRPFVVVKLAATLDGRIAAADGSSRWITSPEARADTHRLRAESDAILVGAATVRADDPELTARGIDAPDGEPVRQPLRVVLGGVAPDARVHPCLTWSGDLEPLLDELGRRDVVQLMVEGGATVAASFHRSRLVDRYVVYLAPALMGGDDGRPMLAGRGAASIDEMFRGHIETLTRLGPDVRIDLSVGPEPIRPEAGPAPDMDRGAHCGR